MRDKDMREKERSAGKHKVWKRKPSLSQGCKEVMSLMVFINLYIHMLSADSWRIKQTVPLCSSLKTHSSLLNSNVYKQSAE